jgi:hypothetical protein
MMTFNWNDRTPLYIILEELTPVRCETHLGKGNVLDVSLSVRIPPTTPYTTISRLT